MDHEPPDRPPLVPRYAGRDYSAQAVAGRRAWIAARRDVALDQLGGQPTDPEACAGNIENLIGFAQVPVGLAGPLVVRGEHADGTFYVPIATTEGALVRSLERGMVVLARAGGALTRVTHDGNQVTPSFRCSDLGAACELAAWLNSQPLELAEAAQATTNHGRLFAVEARAIGSSVLATFRYHTGDASGMNMCVRATDAACKVVVASGRALDFLVLSGGCGEKRPAGALLAGGKGKTVHASATLSAQVLRGLLGVSAADLLELARRTGVAHVATGSLGYNGHVANALAGIFIACGQDAANVANAAVAITSFEPTDNDGLRASVTLPSLTVGTVGGGTSLGTARECLEMLGCHGKGGALRFAEIVTATVLAGEISFAAAIARGDMAAAHERYGRNRPVAT